MVAQVSLKTPTAVAAYIIDRNMRYESKLMDIAGNVQQLSLNNVREELAQIDHLDYMMKQTAAEKIYTEQYNLDHSLTTLQSAYMHILDRHKQFLNSTESIIGIVDPLKTLKRGFSIVKQDGKAVSSIKDLDVSKDIELIMQDGNKKIIS